MSHKTQHKEQSKYYIAIRLIMNIFTIIDKKINYLDISVTHPKLGREVLLDRHCGLLHSLCASKKRMGVV